VGYLDRAKIDVFLLVGEAESAEGETGDANDNEENAYDCGSFHERLPFE
jgi:hypothetical protein